MGEPTRPKSSSKPKGSKKKLPETKDIAKPSEEAADPPNTINSAKPPDARPKKNRQKNAPDKPQPAWLFPRDEENPILNPLSEEQKRKDKGDWDAAVKFLKHRALTAPLKTPPPSQLLTLVGAFLTSFGFNSASRIFTVERNARKVLDGWQDEFGKEPLEKGLPDLVKIYKDWYKEWQEKKELDQTSSDEEGNVATKKAKKASKKQIAENKKVVNQANETSSSGSSSESDSDVEMADATPGKEESKPNAKLDTSSVTSSSSDSDADDEKEASKTTAKTATIEKPAVNGLVHKPKRKASSSSSSSSDTSSSDRELKTIPTKKASVSSSSSPSDTSSSDSESDTSPAKKPLPASASNSSSSSSSSDSDYDTKPVSKAPKSSKNATPGPITDSRKSSTDTSVTLPNGTSTEAPPLKRKRSLSPYSKRLPAVKVAKKSTHESFTRVPKDTKVDEKLASNAYVPYDYAERAHQDLSVTKGKGFTKEKNKKKRGS